MCDLRQWLAQGVDFDFKVVYFLSCNSDSDSDLQMELELWCWWRLGLRFDWISALLALVGVPSPIFSPSPTLKYNLSAFNELALERTKGNKH